MRVIRLVLEYDGSGFSGWQVQPGRRTIQGEIEKALFELTNEKISVIASGRTDAGVHALGQVAGFRTESSHQAFVFKRGLNALLPADVAVLEARDAAPGFNARKSAQGKWYRYLVLDRSEKAALQKDRVWRFPAGLDPGAMREAAARLIGTHDFQSFRASGCEAASSIKHMRRIDVFRNPGGLIVIEMWASAFLKQMARNIVGTLVEVGAGKRKPAEITEILEARNRERAGVCAPPQGLYLVRVDYFETLEDDR